MNRKIIALALAVMMILATVSGCSSGDTADDTATTTTTTSTETSGSTDTETEAGNSEYAANAEALTENVDNTESVILDELSIANTSSPTTLAPWAGNSGGASSIIPLFYETLYTQVLNGELESCLAESKEMESDTVCVYTLFDGITDSAGNPLTSSDVVFSFEQAVSSGKVSAVKLIDSVEAIDDLSFRVTWKDDLMMGDQEGFETAFYIVTEESYNAADDNFATSPVGTGRYVVDEYTSGYRIVLSRRDDYWQTDESKIGTLSQANVQNLILYFITEAASRSVAIENGTVDFAQVSATDADRVSALDGYSLVQTYGGTTSMLFCNASDSSLCVDENLRKAIYYAIDNEGLVAGLTSSPSRVVYDCSNPNYVDYYGDVYEEQAADNFYSQDLDKAAEYLAASSYDGEELELIYGNSETNQNMGLMIQAQLLQVGINVKLTGYQSDIISSYSEDETAWDLFLCSYGSTDYAVNVWDKVFSASKFSWGGTINFVMDDTLQDMLTTARSASTWSEESVTAVHDYIIEHAYGMGLLQGISYTVVPDFCTGLVFTNQNMIMFSACTFEEK